MSQTAIKPTVGRKVWYRPSDFDVSGPGAMNVSGRPLASSPPLDATVIAVWSDTCVNVLVTDITGKQFPKLSVTLLQPGANPPQDVNGNYMGGYVEWMPYQAAQAAKDTAAPIVAQ